MYKIQTTTTHASTKDLGIAHQLLTNHRAAYGDNFRLVKQHRKFRAFFKTGGYIDTFTESAAKKWSDDVKEITVEEIVC